MLRLTVVGGLVGCRPSPVESLPVAPPKIEQRSDAEKVAPPQACECELEWVVRSVPDIDRGTVAATAGGLVWLARGPRLWLSRNGGDEFEPVPLDIADLFAPLCAQTHCEEDVRALWARGSSIYVMTTEQLFIGEQLGTRWRRLAAPTVLMAGNFEAPSPLDGVTGTGERLYLIENVGRVSMSSDGGEHWREELETGRRALQAIAAHDDDAYTTDVAGGVLARHATGAWKPGHVSPSEARLTWLAAGPDGTALALGELNDTPGVWLTLDRGARWSRLEFDGEATALAAGEQAGHWSLATSAGMFHTTDHGAHWQRERMVGSDPELDLDAVRWSYLWRSGCEGYAGGHGRGLYDPAYPYDERTYFAKGRCRAGR